MRARACVTGRGGPASPAPSCPSFCRTLTGAQWDDANHCVGGPDVVVACLPYRLAVNSDISNFCFMRQDGVVVSGRYEDVANVGPDWEGCTPEQTAVVLNGGACR